MKYWWVTEGLGNNTMIPDGFISSPKRMRNGKNLYFYDAKRQVEPRDIIFSFTHKHVISIGIAQSRAYSEDIPEYRIKQTKKTTVDGWKIDVKFKLISKAHQFSPSEHFTEFEQLLPPKYSPLDINGHGSNNAYFTEISEDCKNKIIQLIGKEAHDILDGFEKRISNIPSDNSIPKKIVLDRICFLEQFELFKEKIRINTDPQEKFINFNTGLSREWEFFKLSIFHEARKRLDINSWSPKDIGSGKIINNVISAIEINIPKSHERGESLRNNLLICDDRYGREGNDHCSLYNPNIDSKKKKAYEALLYQFYKEEIEPAKAFDSFIEFAGKRYNFIAYLFFIKDMNKYLPISTKYFDNAFKMLKIPLKTQHNCSWKNYQAYLNIIQQIRILLGEMGVEEVRLIDAHTFCWMLVRLPIHGEFDSKINIPLPEPLSIDTFRPTKEKMGLKDGDKDSAVPIDYEKRNKNNAALGKLAESIVLRAEQMRLEAVGRNDLAEKVDLDYSKDPKYGYDILSYDEDGSKRYIEVKAVIIFDDYYKFIISDYEWQRSQQTDNYFLYFVVKLRSKNPKIKFISCRELLFSYLQNLNYMSFVPTIKIGGNAD